MLKISVLHENSWIERDCPAVFAREKLGTATERLIVNLPRLATNTFRKMTELMKEPFMVLYVLHTPRIDKEPGRYQSEEITTEQLHDFLSRFEPFLCCDARHDVWVRSVSTGDFIVWDRHNDIFIYGDLDKFVKVLVDIGFKEQRVSTLAEHRHFYREEFDADALALLMTFDWHRTPLRAEDEQTRISDLN
jgi:hypothetical protein